MQQALRTREIANKLEATAAIRQATAAGASGRAKVATKRCNSRCSRSGDIGA